MPATAESLRLATIEAEERAETVVLSCCLAVAVLRRKNGPQLPVLLTTGYYQLPANS